jgi:hypothetical protein
MGYETTFNDTVSQFRKEFGDLAEHFHHVDLSIADSRILENTQITRPDVYVLWTNGRVMKVGRHLVDAPRAGEHVV